MKLKIAERSSIEDLLIQLCFICILEYIAVIKEMDNIFMYYNVEISMIYCQVKYKSTWRKAGITCVPLFSKVDKKRT
jgi:hypothetical protein